jgi:hypothetical protein
MDDISKAFDTLTPEDLIRDTSAIDISTLDEPAIGSTAWESWVTDLVLIAQKRAREGNFWAFAQLGSALERRIFVADGDETPEMWSARLHREAVQSKATWFFLSMLAPARSYNEDGEVPDHIEPTAEEINRAIDDGELEIGVCWLAQRADEQGSSQRAGIITLDESGRPLDQTEGLLTEDNTFYHVLDRDHAV